MKKLFIVFCIVAFMGCSTFGSIKVEDIDVAEKRLQQIALALGSMDGLDEAIDLLAKAKLALDAGDKVKAKEYRDAMFIIMDILEDKDIIE